MNKCEFCRAARRDTGSQKVNGLFCGLAEPPWRPAAKRLEASTAALSTEISVVWGRYISVGAP